MAALSACVAIVALWSVERTEVPHDLQLAAESRARPGETIALRALLFRDVDRAEGPSLARAQALVRLLDAHDVELARVALAPTPLATLDGALTLPTHAAGPLVLEASAEFEGRTLTSRRALQLDDHAAPGPLHGREAGPLQQLAIGRVVVSGSSPPPDPWLVRVVGGACVPEQACTLLVWVGEPAAAIALRPGSNVTASRPAQPAGEGVGLTALEVVVHGPDGEVTLEARRGAQLVAERSIRLPVALGEVGLFTPKAIASPASLAFRYALPPGRADVLVDVFAAGRWRAAQVAARPGAGPSPVDPRGLPVGITRFQARIDRFGSDGSGARVVYLRAPEEDEPTALTRLARALAADPTLAGEPTAAWGRTLPAFAFDDVQRTAAFLLAPLEQLRMSVPAPASGRPRALAALARTKVKLRFGVASALALSALVIGLSIARRGLSAADEAEAILAEAGADSQNISPTERFRERARVLLLVLAVAAAFLAGALLIAAKPLWF